MARWPRTCFLSSEGRSHHGQGPLIHEPCEGASLVLPLPQRMVGKKLLSFPMGHKQAPILLVTRLSSASLRQLI